MARSVADFPVGSRSQEEYPPSTELCESERAEFDELSMAQLVSHVLLNITNLNINNRVSIVPTQAATPGPDNPMIGAST